jgi:hypothetical protein
MFERICRENGITQRSTKPRSPTTTGKIERFHGTLRRELLDACGPFESLTVAQAGIDAWVHAHNHQRLHQSLNMATPSSLFRPAFNPVPSPAADPAEQRPLTPLRTDRLEPAERHGGALGEAVEADMVISPSGRIVLLGNNQLKFPAAMAGHPVTIWADLRSIHVTLAGELIRSPPQARWTTWAGEPGAPAAHRRHPRYLDRRVRRRARLPERRRTRRGDPDRGGGGWRLWRHRG